MGQYSQDLVIKYLGKEKDFYFSLELLDPNPQHLLFYQIPIRLNIHGENSIKVRLSKSEW